MNIDSTSSALISSDNVDGTKVYNAAGEKLGTIDCVMIDKVTGEVRYAVLEFGGFLGMGTDRYPIPWSALKYDSNQDGYLAPLDKERLNDAPRYVADDRPPFTEEYGRGVYDYYGQPWYL